VGRAPASKFEVTPLAMDKLVKENEFGVLKVQNTSKLSEGVDSEWLKAMEERL